MTDYDTSTPVPTTTLSVGDTLDVLPPGRGRIPQWDKMRDLMDAHPGSWVVLRVGVSKAYPLAPCRKAAEKWDGQYDFVTRTIDGVKVLLGHKS